jgi:alpha-D-ribose 1-methylphosphonate 5-triphosphate synthase subunit PhnG
MTDTLPLEREFQTRDRRHWMSTLAKAQPWELETAVARIAPLPSYSILRDAEPGLVMVRGRAGGTGALFNLGEMTVTRATIQMEHRGQNVLGLSYVCGRSRRHAELAALCDALLQIAEWHERVAKDVLALLENSSRERRAERLRRVQPTKVEFFTVVRGENA